MGEPFIVVGALVRNLHPEDVVDGSVHVPCVTCDEPTWVSPASQRLLQGEDGSVMCTVCADVMRRAGERMHVQMTPGSMDELREHLRRKGAKEE